MPKTKVPTEKLRGIRPHIEYEWTMLNTTANRLFELENRSEMPADGVKSAVVESFATHAWNLIEFLFCRSSQRYNYVRVDDYLGSDFADWQVRSGQYAADGSWKGSRSQAIYEMACQQVNHLTYERIGVTAEGKKWWFDAWGEEIWGWLSALREFATEKRQEELIFVLSNLRPFRIEAMSCPPTAIARPHRVLRAAPAELKTDASTPSPNLTAASTGPTTGPTKPGTTGIAGD